MDRLPPLTGPMAVGPLGLAHLPRMWQKGILSTVGWLPEEYHFVTRGFDQWLCEGVGIDMAAFGAFARTLPSYLAAEDWVRANATALDRQAATNEKLLTMTLPAEALARMQASTGISDPTFTTAVRMLNLDDLVWLHQFALAHRSGFDETIVPAVTGRLTGELGLLHLPRLWAKAIIKAIGALPAGYHSGSGPLDEQCAQAIGLDLAAAVAYINAEFPTEVQFERWVREHATDATPSAIAAWNEAMNGRQKREQLATDERAILGITDPSFRSGLILNDLLDWHELHQKALAYHKTR